MTLIQGGFFAVASFVLFWFLAAALVIASVAGFWYDRIPDRILPMFSIPEFINLHAIDMNPFRFTAGYFTYQVAQKVKS